MLPLTGLIISDNHTNSVKKSIACLSPWCKEIIIIDINSTLDLSHLDLTNIQIHKVLSSQYNPEAIIEIGRNLCSTNWILLLYGNEIIRKPLIQFMLQIIEQNTTDALYIPRMNYGFGYWLNGNGFWPNEECRLFKKDKVYFSKQGITFQESTRSSKIQLSEGENIEENSASAKSIIRFNYTSSSEFMDQLNKNTDRSSKKLKQSGVFYTNELHKSHALMEYTNRFINPPKSHMPIEVREGFAIFQAMVKWVEWFKMWELQTGHDEEQITKKYSEMIDTFFELDG